MKLLFFALLSLVLLPQSLTAQKTFPVNGVHDDRPEVYALTNARIVVSPDNTISKGTLVIGKGKVLAAAASAAIPPEAVVIDMSGKTIYPSFIDLDTDYGLPEPKKQKESAFGDPPQSSTKKKGAYNWNQAIRPEIRACDIFEVDEKQARKWRKQGFGAVLSFQHDGVARGSSVLVSLADDKEQRVILKGEAGAHYSFDKGSSTQNYPGSLMGAIALLRQTYLDAAWYAQPALAEEFNISLDAWNKVQRLPQFFEVTNKLDLLRCDKVGDEFKVQYIIRSGGDEYQRIDAVKKAAATLIVPLNFPLPYDLADPFDAFDVSLANLKHWELAPSNPAALEEAGIRFALTTALLKKRGKFWPNLRKAIQYGLSKKGALAALTTVPAGILGVEDQLGTLAAGKLANFIVTSGDIFADEVVIYQNWVQGRKYEITNLALADLRGDYELEVDDIGRFELEIKGKINSPKLKAKSRKTEEQSGTISMTDHMLSLSFPTQDKGEEVLRLTGWVGATEWSGRAQSAEGTWHNWRAKKTDNYEAKEKDAPEKPASGKLSFPLTAYGWERLPQAASVLIKNATIWTCEADGIMENADILIENGKIAQIGRNLSAGGARVVDAAGKHVTPGIIDEHSHIAISRGVNEWTQASSAEVRIGDVVNSDDVNIYRQLAGGVTTSQLLHGSANPIGGQSALIKLRWGRTPEEMKFANADPFIKFALGENVKQSNWGDLYTIRFPQTRMGVEQVFFDHFTRAVEYEQAWKSYNALSGGARQNQAAPRRDLELEALLEIVNSERFITCHSYVQSEINMLMKTAEHFGFRINTFTHILEGFKVADIMEDHGAGGSSFSDWWAYKYEVIDAIPYNGAILHQMGVVTAFNSDSPEMARRLNQEAAKAVKYGGLSEEDALKFVTLNPAKLLHIDDRVGSLKVGKDADLVLWNDNPLSIYARAEQTYIDGILYYDIERDQELRSVIADERRRLTVAMQDAKNKGSETRKSEKTLEHHFHCDDIHDYGHAGEHHHSQGHGHHHGHSHGQE